jgi:hypothetical protein
MQEGKSEGLGHFKLCTSKSTECEAISAIPTCESGSVQGHIKASTTITQHYSIIQCLLFNVIMQAEMCTKLDKF